MAAVDASTPRAPTAATASKATRSRPTTSAKVATGQVARIKVAFWPQEPRGPHFTLCEKGLQAKSVVCLFDAEPLPRPHSPLCILPPDVDECVLPGVCPHGRCVNLEGAYRCTCDHGYQVTADGRDCEGRARTRRSRPSGVTTSLALYQMLCVSSCQTSTSARLATCALPEFASTTPAPLPARAAGLALRRPPMA